MIEFVAGLIGMILLYFLGNLLYPGPSEHTDTTPKPWQLDFQRHEKNRKEAQEDE